MSEPDRLRVMIVQENAIAGDLEANSRMARAAHDLGVEAGADLVVLPEMFLSGYHLGDLAVRPAFLRDCHAAIEALAKVTRAGGPALAIGMPVDASDEVAAGSENGEAHAYNALMLLQDGAIRACFKKHDVDEKRLFREGPAPGPIEIAGCRIGFPIGEDISGPDVAETLEESGAELLIVPSAIPYARGQHDRRMQHAIARVIETELPLIQLNMIGGQDELVFDGGSFALNPGGQLAAQLPLFDRHIRTLDLERGEDGWRIVPSELASIPGETALDYRAMVEALRDYVQKSGFTTVLLGLSGGIDSSIVATLAVDALGPANVRCVWLPSRYSSTQSERDAAEQARRLGVQLDTVPIEIPIAAIETGLSPLFARLAPDLTEENIQSRLRGLILMALSNKFGELLLTTGNKSEAAVGYATIYGDMCGGFNPIEDLYKTRVFECCRWRNAEHYPWMRGPAGTVIPLNILQKPPSAELRPDQRDEDSLPPYPVLDRILQLLIEEERSIAEIVEAGFERDVVMQVQELVYRSEYKRFQAAPGVKLTPKMLSRDRHYPLVNRWRDRS